jgi:hypothetical protein
MHCSDSVISGGGGIYGAAFAVTVACGPLLGCCGAVWVRLQGRQNRQVMRRVADGLLRLRCSRSWAR